VREVDVVCRVVVPVVDVTVVLLLLLLRTHEIFNDINDVISNDGRKSHGAGAISDVALHLTTATPYSTNYYLFLFIYS